MCDLSMAEFSSRPLVSVVVTTFSISRVPYLLELLGSLACQTYSNLEIVFVGEGLENIYERVSDCVQRLNLHTTIVRNTGPRGASAARNLGVRQARGEIVAFLDDDVVAYPDWASELVHIFDEDQSIVGVAGAVHPMWANPSMTWFPEEFYWIIGCTGFLGWNQITETGHAATVNAAYTREALDCAGLFNASLGLHRGEWGKGGVQWWEVGGEDGELSMRVRRMTGKRVVFAPNVRVWHRILPERLRLMSIAQRSWAVGRERGMLRELFSGPERAVLYEESVLVRRILFHLLPRMTRGLLTDPSNAWKQLGVTTISSLFAGFGYVTYPLLRQRKVG